MFKIITIKYLIFVIKNKFYFNTNYLIEYKRRLSNPLFLYNLMDMLQMSKKIIFLFCAVIAQITRKSSCAFSTLIFQMLGKRTSMFIASLTVGTPYSKHWKIFAVN